MSISVNSDFCLLEPAAWNLINFRALIRQTETADIRQRPPAGYLVPQAVGEQSQDRPFAALVLDAKAVAQITGSFFLTWPASGQRELPTTTVNFRVSQSRDFWCRSLVVRDDWYGLRRPARSC